MTDHRRSLFQTVCRRLLYLLLFITPFSVAAIEILFPLLLVTWILGWRIGAKKNTPSVWDSAAGRMVLHPLLVYAAICTWSVFFSSDPTLSLIGLIGKTYEYILLFIIACDAVDRPPVARNCIRALLASSLLVGLYGVVQQLSGYYDPIRNRPMVYTRMIGPYPNPNDLATLLMVVLTVIVAQILGKPKRLQIGLGLLGIFLGYCFVNTSSKGALLGFIPGLIVLLTLFPLPKGLRIGTTAAIFLIAALVLAHKGHFLQALSFSDPGSMERRVMWSAAWRMIKDQPIIGLGPNTFMANYLRYATGPNQGPAYAHNCFIQIAAETGIISLIFFLLFLGSLFFAYGQSIKISSNLRRAPLKPILSGLAIALFAFLIQSAFDTNLYALRQATLFWTLAGITFGASQMVAWRLPSQDDKNRKILRVIARLNIGGPAQQAVALSDRLADFGWSTTLIAGQIDPGEGDMRYLLTDRIRYKHLPFLQRKLHFLNDLRTFGALLWILFRERPALLHTHTAKAGALGRSAGLAYRFITGAPLVMVHTFHGHVFHGYFGPIATKLFCGIERRLSRFTDCIVAVSQTVKEDLVKLRIAPARRIRVLSLGPSLDRFLKIDPPVFEEPLKIGMVGRLTGIKNHPLLFEAAQMLRQSTQLDHTQFLLVGDGELRPTLESAVRQMDLLEHIRFLGWQTDLPAVYQSLHILCLTSKNEGTPVAILEAMAAARAVVATDVGGVRDLLGKSTRPEIPGSAGEFEICERGLLVPSEDAKTLSKALHFLMSHPQVSLQMGMAGREFVRRSVSAEQLVGTTHRLYQRLTHRWLR